jgi:diguanylate cyclase (GGDEF)-like protein
MANRLGSLSESNLRLQEQDIEQQYAELTAKVEQLQQIGAEGGLGFQGEESLPIIVSSSAQWLVAYKKIKELHATDAWRADVKQMKESVEPLFLRVWNSLIDLDRAIEARADADMQTLGGATETQSRIFWMVTTLCVVFIVAGFFALERMVLRPLWRVSLALKAEASGNEKVELPATSAAETQHLLDAFAEMRKQVQSRQTVLEHQAMHDGLTNLPNRTLLSDRLQQAIHTAKRRQRALAVMILDLDRFKEVNDTLGHEVGDRLLTEVASRMSNLLRDTDTIARFGGDEFCVLLTETDPLRAQQVAQRLIGALEEPVIVGEQHLLIGASIGIAAFPQHGDTPQTLIQRADVAMYVAKRNRTGYSIYDADNDQHSVQRLALVSDLRDAIDGDTLELHYQPKIALGDGNVVGVEALLRWHHPKLGRIPPDQIIPLAEQTGLIRPLTRWVLGTALRQCTAWKQERIDLHVAVNLSPYCLQDNELADWISQWFRNNPATTSDLVLEITESAMMSDPNKAIEVLTRFDEMGISISVDDFGTGFSSLACLKKLPIDELKVDRSFVMDMMANDNDAVIVRSTIDLAHNLGLRVVAEGVEDVEKLEYLKILRCDFAQGYHISRPVPAQELKAWYRSHAAGTFRPVMRNESATA